MRTSIERRPTSTSAHESLYVGMPPPGLGTAFGLTEDRSRRRHARITRGEPASGSTTSQDVVS